MYIEELKEGDSDSCGEQQVSNDLCKGTVVIWDPKRVLVGAGARALFYPTLLYNVVRNKIQSEFRWWDRVDEAHEVGAQKRETVKIALIATISHLSSLCKYGQCKLLDESIIPSHELFLFFLPESMWDIIITNHLTHCVLLVFFHPLEPLPVHIQPDLPSFRANNTLGVIYNFCLYVLLGAVPFPTDVPRLKALGVGGVVTLNEPYETLVPTSLYHDHSIEHLVIPTRDYLFAPSHGDICQAVEFIHGNALCGKTTYVHCKAGRGRSTTIVLCYLVKHKQMTPEAAFQYVRSIRPRVLLASAQWQAVQDYFHGLNISEAEICVDYLPITTLGFPSKVEPEEFDDNSLVLITESDLDGYDENLDSCVAGQSVLSELNLACKVQFASQAAISRLSCLWLRCQTGHKVSTKELTSTVRNSRMGSMGVVDIHVY